MNKFRIKIRWMDKGSKDGFYLTGAIGFESSYSYDQGIGLHYGLQPGPC